MAIFNCPKCLVGKMDSSKGVKGACWYCSQFVDCYVCDNVKPLSVFGQQLNPNADKSVGVTPAATPPPACGFHVCQKDLQKILNAQADPKSKEPIPFKKGPADNHGP